MRAVVLGSDLRPERDVPGPGPGPTTSLERRERVEPDGPRGSIRRDRVIAIVAWIAIVAVNVAHAVHR